jgi:hypothetical protein
MRSPKVRPSFRIGNALPIGGRIGRWSRVPSAAAPQPVDQFHQFRLTADTLIQVGFTVPMGIVFERLRQESGSLWPGRHS